MDSSKALNLGVAAHITAAAPGGPRYESALAENERAGADNGIWLCQNCAKLVDNDPMAFSSTMLRSWKQAAEQNALMVLGKSLDSGSGDGFSGEEIELLVLASDKGEMLMFSADQIGSWIRVDSKDFLDKNDPALAARYLEAMETLQQKGFVQHAGGIRYQLTWSGFKIGRDCAKRLRGSID